MKKKKKNKLFKYIFIILLGGFTVVYFSELTGYYQYQNYKKSALTHEKIKEFEKDVASGKEVDIKQYLVQENITYDNKLSKLTSKLSNAISDVVKSGVEGTFKYLSKMIDE